MKLSGPEPHLQFWRSRARARVLPPPDGARAGHEDLVRGRRRPQRRPHQGRRRRRRRKRLLQRPAAQGGGRGGTGQGVECGVRNTASLGRVLKGSRVQGWAKEWSLGCVIPASWTPLAAGARFMQSRDHFVADPCGCHMCMPPKYKQSDVVCQTENDLPA